MILDRGYHALLWTHGLLLSVKGRVTSYRGVAGGAQGPEDGGCARYTSFQGGRAGSCVRALWAHPHGILSLTPNALRCNSRTGKPLFLLESVTHCYLH